MYMTIKQLFIYSITLKFLVENVKYMEIFELIYKWH